MNCKTIANIHEKLEKYSLGYLIGNDFILAFLSDENKEMFLNELDLILPCGLIFSHEYTNGILKVKLKEVQ